MPAPNATMRAKPSRNGEGLGATRTSSRPGTTIRARNTTCSRCSPIRRGASTWAMCATTRWATWSRATGAPRGFNVLHPMGWDAFGLPAENAAMQNKRPSREMDLRQHRRDAGAVASRWACRSTGRARSRPAIRAITSTSRSCSSISSPPAWSSARSRKVNWDPVDQTVLANEQVIDGRGWRSGALVEQRELTQWFFKITDYSRGSARRARHARPLAGKSPADAEELDRPLGGPAGPLRARRRRRRRAARQRARHLSRRARTRCSARNSWRSRPTIRWPPPRRRRPGARRVHRGVPAHRHRRTPRSRRRRRRATTPASERCIRSTRTGRCRSMSPISS